MSFDDRVSAELGDPPDAKDLDDALLSDAVLTDLNSDEYNEEKIAELYGITVEEVQRICGARGHEMQTYDQGDATTTYFQTWRCCCLCGAPDDYDEPFGSEFEP